MFNMEFINITHPAGRNKQLKDKNIKNILAGLRLKRENQKIKLIFNRADSDRIARSC